MKNKRISKLLTILSALVIVLLIQTQYIKSEEKQNLIQNNENATTEISDKVEKNSDEHIESKEEPLVDESSEEGDKLNLMTEVEVNEPTPVVINPGFKPTPVITYHDIEKTISIEFQTETIADANINKGESKIEVKGVLGKRQILTQEKYSDGKLVSTKEISNKIIVNPTKQVVRQGTKMPTANISSEQAKAMFNAINQSRAQEGKVQLTWSNDLAKAATIRSKEISESFSHTRPNGQNFNTVNPSIVFGENIASASSNAQETHVLFMNSAGHRDNILETDFKSVGISTYKIPDKPGATYWSVLFNY